MNRHPFAIVFQVYTVTQTAIVVIWKSGVGLAYLWVAQYPLQWGWWMLHWRDGRMDMLNLTHWLGWLNLTGAALMLIGAAIAFGGIEKIFQTLPSITPRRFADAPGRSRLASRAELRRAGLISDKKGIFALPDDIPQWNRTYFGLTPDRHATTCLTHTSRHLTLLGGTRAGKDARIIIPNLARLRRSVFLIDPRGEDAAVIYRHRARFSRMIVINPFGQLTDTHPHLKSHGFNCLALPEFDPANEDFNDNADDLAESLIKWDSEDSFFPTSGQALISGLIMGARIKYGPRATLKHVREWLAEDYGTHNSKPIGLFKMIIELCELGYEPIKARLAQFLTPQGSSIDVINTVRSQTKWMDSPPIARDLRGEAIDFERLKHELTTVIVILPTDKLETHYSIWLRLVLGSALRAMQRTLPGNQNVLVVANECAQLGFLNTLRNCHNIGAGHGIQLLTVWQSLAQIKAIYRDNYETVLGARGHLAAFAPQDLVTAKYLSELIGYHTQQVTSYEAKPGKAQEERQDTPHGFPFYRPEDLMRLPPGRLINFSEHVPFPFETHAPGYWELPWCRSLDPNPYYKPKSAAWPLPGRARPLPPPPLSPSQPVDYGQRLRDLLERRKKS